MAMPQRDDPPTPRLRRTGKIEAIKRLEPPSRKRYGGPGALLECAVMHGDEAEAACLREELRKLGLDDSQSTQKELAGVPLI